ncbi:capsular biosynthesis protein [Microbulbifer celer]|uniref:Capsular biosynthesis protein n=1 Tax=Microbulbifer celer TaxID=435905 RepID=A0ABW3UA37_9GAMM|nr:capsular biosynthesis protein [Microbulbifer celer]UFN58980.1 capsular biosynthesis protein [Microbulbifer celer]
MKADILISDPVHIHRKNFSSLFEYLDKCQIRYKEFSQSKNLRNVRIRDCIQREELAPYIDSLRDLDEDEMVDFECNGINVNNVVEYELLDELIFDGLSSYKYLNVEDLIRFVYKNHHSLLITSYALAMYWIDLWMNLSSTDKYRYVIIFSGASISTRALTKCCELLPTEPLLVESFFTGAHYYLENRYSPLPNKSDVKFFREKADIVDAAKWKVSSGYLSNVSQRNKNVKQPSHAVSQLNSCGYVLIACQVINDYSLLNSRYPKVASTDIYLTIIKDLLNKTDLDVFVKVHPWEKVKLSREVSLTEEVIQGFVRELSEKNRKRIKLIESENLSMLIEGCIAFVSICSQSALEAAFLGKKPIVSSSAFFASKGFSYEFSQAEDVASYILDENYSAELSLNEYDKFINFMNYCIHGCLVEEKLTAASAQKLSKAFSGCASARPQGNVVRTTYPEYKYLVERNFVKRNIFKILERPAQILIDVRVVFKTLFKRVS